MLQKLKDLLDSEEGQKSIQEWVNKINNESLIKESQLERFHISKHTRDRFVFDLLIKKLIHKYDSDKYRDKWWKLGYEPPENLYWFIFHYAEKYGKELTDEEYELYGNMFVTSGYKILNYAFVRMDGQGSVVKITKIKI